MEKIQLRSLQLKKKGFIDISFGWVFALIVGAFILFLAIFISVKIIKNQGSIQGAEVSKSLGMVLEPLETGFEDSKTTILELGIKSEIENICETEGDFGRQKIKTSQEIFNKQQGGDIEVGFYNKYIFSEEIISGKSFYIFSKRFDFPFKVADLVFIIPEEKIYCFFMAPENITNATRDLKLDNIINVKTLEDCPKESEKVCFSQGSSCETRVNLLAGFSEKNNKKIYFEGDALMYASIFSDLDIYECQLKRIMKRVESLSILYEQKKDFVKEKNCNSVIDFALLKNSARGFAGSEDIKLMAELRNTLENQNKYAQCKIW